ncbi:MAG: hypothetical protein ABR600_07845 [Actinomycetota bacterium]
MKIGRKIRTGAVSLLVVSAVAGLVWAGIGSAGAHIVPSYLTLNASPQTTKAKHTVLFFGRLRTPGHPKCGHFSNIGLYRVGHKRRLVTLTTGKRGYYETRRHVHTSGNFYTKFNGRTVKPGSPGYGYYGYGSTPTDGCSPTTSNRVHVTVKHKHH